MLARTDANGAGWVVPGFALHDEFDLCAAAGPAPLAILRATTLTPARFFGRESVASQVAAGRAADLVVVDGDPVEDHRALHAIRAVVRAKNLWVRGGLDAVLDRLAATPSAR